MPLYFGDQLVSGYTSSKNTDKKIYLIGAETQGEDVETFSHDTVYVGEDGFLYNDGERVARKSEIPTVPTKISAFTNDAGYAKTSEVKQEIANLVNSAPEKLNTLDELAAALGDDENFANTVTAQISKKQDQLTGEEGQFVIFNAEQKPIAQTISLITANDITNAINTLDSIIEAEDGKYISAITQADGKVQATKTSFPVTSISKGGTGATTATEALKNLGITVTTTELNHTSGVTSNIQTQLNNKINTVEGTEGQILGLNSKKEVIAITPQKFIFWNSSTETQPTVIEGAILIEYEG